MKKAIGLTANISDFRPNLPQTKHLNYFMGTNPIYMAKGGDVKAGIPNYPDVNVTRGFLPAALGFDNGGEADSYWSKLYKAAVKVVAGYLGKDENDEKVQETAKKFIGTDQGKKIAEQIIQSEQGASAGAYDSGFPIPEEQKIASKADEVWPTTVTPTETVTEIPKNTIPGGYYGAPPATSQTTPGIGPRLETSPGLSTGAPVRAIAPKADEVWPPQNGGITEIKPESKNPLDLNGDGEVNMEDLEYAKNNPLLSWAIPALKKILGIVEDWNPDEPEKEIEKDTEKEIEKDTEKEIEKDDEKIIPKFPKPPKDSDGITGLPEISKEQRDRDIEDEWTGIGPDEQKLLKLLAAERAKNTGQPDSGGITDKKDVPAWALPMMSAGFAMMASKSPSFMQALGEGGQKGLETFTAQETAKEEKLDKEAERAYKKSMATYYEGREQKPDIKVMTVDGRGVYHRWDDATQDYVSLNRIAVPSDADIEKELSEGVHALSWATYTTEKKQELITERRNRYLGIVQSNLSTVEEKGGSIMDKIKKLEEIIESWNPDKKDGGIVSLRR